MYNDNIVVIKGIKNITIEENQSLDYTFEVNYPEGFSKDSIVLAFGTKRLDESKGYSYGTRGTEKVPGAFVSTAFGKSVTLLSDRMIADFYYSYDGASHSKESYSIEYEIVLMKVPSYAEGIDYKLGDINEDGNIDQTDLDLLNDFFLGKTSLTEKQIKTADVNKYGVLNSGDTFKLAKYINGQISSFD